MRIIVPKNAANQQQQHAHHNNSRAHQNSNPTAGTASSSSSVVSPVQSTVVVHNTTSPTTTSTTTTTTSTSSANNHQHHHQQHQHRNQNHPSIRGSDERKPESTSTSASLSTSSTTRQQPASGNLSATISRKTDSDTLDGYNSGDEYCAKKPITASLSLNAVASRIAAAARAACSTSSGSVSTSSTSTSSTSSASTGEEGVTWKEIRLPGNKKQRLMVRKMLEDGNCLFRAIADQVYGDQDMHSTVRQLCMDFLEAERDHYSQFVTEDFEAYLNRKRKDKCFGNNIEIQAICEIYNRPIEVYTNDAVPLNIFQSYNTDNAPIRLSYNGINHYDSLVDPYGATIGVGLGLPDFKPGLADKMYLEKAMKVSEDDDLERKLLMDLQRETDWEVTEKELEEAAIAASLAEYWQSFARSK